MNKWIPVKSVLLDPQSYTTIDPNSHCLCCCTGNYFQSGFWQKVVLIFKLLLGNPHSFLPMPSYFVADLCYWVDFFLWLIVPYIYNFLNLRHLYPRKVISDLQVFWKHCKDVCQMESLMSFQIYLLSLLLGVNQRAWEIILWLAFKTKPKQKLLSFHLFH